MKDRGNDHPISHEVRKIFDSISPSKHSYTVYAADDDDPNARPPKVFLFHKRPGFRMTSVFGGALAVVLVVVTLCALFPESFLSVTTAINSFLTTTFGWYYLLLVAAVVFLLHRHRVLLSRKDPSGASELKTRALDGLVVRHALFCRHGHRIGVLWCCRAALSFRHLGS